MAKSAKFKNDELLTGGIINEKLEVGKKSKSNESMGDLVFIDIGEKRHHTKQVDSFFGQVSN